MPNSGEPDSKVWTPYILDNSPFDFDKDLIIIGHSAGAVEALYLIEALDQSVGGMILVAAFRDDLGWPALKNLFHELYSFEKIQAKCSKIVFIHSDDDPHCPMVGAEYLSSQLSARLVIMTGMKHFSVNTDPRFTELPEILPVIESIL